MNPRHSVLTSDYLFNYNVCKYWFYFPPLWLYWESFTLMFCISFNDLYFSISDILSHVYICVFLFIMNYNCEICQRLNRGQIHTIMIALWSFFLKDQLFKNKNANREMLYFGAGGNFLWCHISQSFGVHLNSKLNWIILIIWPFYYKSFVTKWHLVLEILR